MMCCGRCGGLLVSERIEAEGGGCAMMRCTSCGNVEDDLIRAHRLHRPELYGDASLPVYDPAKRPRPMARLLS